MLEYVSNETCSNCGSQKGVGVYKDDGGRLFKWCYSCERKVDEGSSKKGSKSSLVNVPKLSFPHLTLEFRKLTKDTCVKYDVRTSNASVYFPCVIDGRITGYKVRDFLYPKKHDYHMRIVGKYDNFFGLPTIHTSKIVAIALGEFDAMAVYQATNIPCLSPPNGDSSLVRTVKKNFDLLMSFEKVVIVPDKDKGKASTKKQPSDYVKEVVELLGYEKVCVASPSFDDPNEYLMRGQPSALKSLFWSARHMTQDLFYESASQLIRPTLVGRLTGMPCIDNLMHGLRESECTYVIGAPSKGKTTFTRNLIWLLSQRGVRSSLLVLEGTADKFVTGLASTFYGDNIHAATDEERQGVADEIDTNLVVSTANGRSDYDFISNVCKAAVKIHDCEVIIVDNITAMSDPTKTNESTSQLVKMFEGLSADLRCHFVIISHVGRGHYDDVPDMGSSALTSTIDKMADNIIGIWREKQSCTLKGRVVKCREIGASAEKEFQMQFDPQTNRYITGNRAVEWST